MARGRHAGSSEAKLLQALLEACGQCEEVPEALVDIHTGLSGSGVAYVSVAVSPAPGPALGKVETLSPCHDPGLRDSMTWFLGCL